MKRVYTDLLPAASPGVLCPLCGGRLAPGGVCWQGAHVCAESSCHSCSAVFLCDLPSVQGAISPFLLEKKTRKIFGTYNAPWFSQILSDMVAAPSLDDIQLRVKRHKEVQEIVVVNCLDFCYGHSLCALLSVKEAIDSNPTKGIVLIINSNMEWLVPEGVAEEWVVDIPLSRMKTYFPRLNDKINAQLKRFQQATLYSGYTFSVPIDFSPFSRTKPYDLDNSKPGRVTFIWRDDNTRCWIPNLFLRRLSAHFTIPMAAELQRRVVISFFKRLRKLVPAIECVVSGLGTHGRFPEWIIDDRTANWNRAAEERHVTVLAESQLAVGVEGSHLLIPSGHAGMTICLMPLNRWGVIAEDLSVRSAHPRDTLLRYRIIPMETNAQTLVCIAQAMLNSYHYCRRKLVEHP